GLRPVPRPRSEQHAGVARAATGHPDGHRRCGGGHSKRRSVAPERCSVGTTSPRRGASVTLPDAAVAAAYLDSCLAELSAPKPGNVHVFAGGHDMTTADFEASARVSAPVMGRRGLSVGERILGAIKATRSVVGCNTNLGIVLLCAPLATAAMQAGGGLRD